ALTTAVVDPGRDVVAAERKEAQRRGILAPHVERPNRIEKVQLFVEAVSSVLSRQERLRAGEREIVERRVVCVAEKEEADHADRVRAREVDAEDRPPRTPRRERRLIAGVGVGVAGGIEEERVESRARQILGVLGTLEGRGAGELRQE